MFSKYTSITMFLLSASFSITRILIPALDLQHKNVLFCDVPLSSKIAATGWPYLTLSAFLNLPSALFL